MKKQLPAWAALAIISLVAGLLLALTNALTADRIAAQALIDADKARFDVWQTATAFEQVPIETSDYGLDNVYAALDEQGQVIGYTGQITVNGFGGPIEIVAGVDMTGALSGVNVGGEAFSETAGLGAKTKDAAFTDQFDGLEAPLVLKEDVDSVTGASISSGAVVAGVNKISGYILEKNLKLTEAEVDAPLTGDIRTAQAKGFLSTFDVSIGVDESGAITGVQIGGDGFGETPGLGERVKEKAFRDQFIGKSGALAYGEDGLEAISGATITSTAVLDAINGMLGGEAIATEDIDMPGFEATPEPVPTILPEATPEPVAEPVAAAPADALTTTVKGFGGEIEVSITLDDAGKIATMQVGGANFAETAGLGARAQEAAFTDQFIGKSGTLAYGDGLDALTGATVTSNAVLSAVNELLGNEAEEPAEKAEPAAEPEAAAEPAALTTTVKGFGGEIEVSITLDDAGKIASMQVGGANFAETAGLGARAQEAAFTDQFIGKSGTLAYGDGLDALTGATITSNAVLSAVNELLSK